MAKALEKRINALQSQKLVIEEKMSSCGRPIRPYDEMYRTSLKFLQEPHKIWANGRFEDKRAVLKLAFTDRLTYVRNEGYRTPDLSLPFKMLGNDFDQKKRMARPAGFEPTTPWFVAKYSIQLSYGRKTI